MANENLQKAKKAKNDEFYTQYEDVVAELKHYSSFLKGKVVYCNCDDPTRSAFWKYFHLNFDRLGLKGLISTHYDETQPTYKMEYMGGSDNDIKSGVKTPLEGDGDFRSEECIDVLKQSDVVATNPPFSLFREYVAQLIKYKKKFLILGNMNAITYKEIFPLIKNNSIWVGYGFNISLVFKTPYPNLLEANRKFVIAKGYDPNEGYVKTPAICWFTNIDHAKRHQILPLDLGYTYYGHEEMYPKYDNYDAINVDKVSQIPSDYEPCWFKCPYADLCKYSQTKGKEDNALCEQPRNGEIGVPITYLDKHSPEQFEIVGADYEVAKPIELPNGKTGSGRFYLNDNLTSNNKLNDNPETDRQTDRQLKRLYGRIVIRKEM